MKPRIQSVDILRGVTIVAMILVNTPGTWSHVYEPLLHASWHGLTPTDLIFPFFLIIVGISIYFAYKQKNRGFSIYKKISIRSLKLIGLGLFLNLFLPYLPFITDLSTVRIPGVLQRIGIVFFVTSLLYLHCNWKVLLGVAITLIFAYWLFLGFVPLPDGTLPTFDRLPNNWSNFIDSNILGEHMWKSDYDPEGLFSTLPSIASCLFGVLLGKQLDSLEPMKLLLFSAFSFLALGYVLDMWFPINKAIWSSSFVLVTSGWASLILSMIYFITDVKKIQFGAVFKYVGMNAITIYFLSSFISKSMYLTKVGEHHNLHSYVYNEVFVQSFFSDKLSSFLYALVVVLFYLWIGYVLYKKKIIIKV
ncbi:MAG: DUF1624 domain-containing protein [Flavobacteriaceae bacterium]